MFFNHAILMAILVQLCGIFCVTYAVDVNCSEVASGSMLPPRRDWAVNKVQTSFAAILINVLHEKIYNYFTIIESIRYEQEKRYQEESDMDVKVRVWNEYESQIKLHFDYTCRDIENDLIPEIMETHDSKAITSCMELYYNFRCRRLQSIKDSYETL